MSILGKLTRIAFLKGLRGKKTVASIRIKNLNLFSYGYDNLDNLFREVFCNNEYLFTAHTPSPVIIDCGANIGTATLYFKLLYPQCRILAFEANPATFKMRERNITQNDLKDVCFYQVALFDKEGAIPFYIDENPGSGMGSLLQGRKKVENKVLVQAEKLSDYLKEIEKVDLLKMDIEGAEVNVVNDLFDSLAIEKVDQLLIEYHHNIDGQNSCLSAFLKRFEDFGYGYNLRAKYYTFKSIRDVLIHFYKR